MSTEYELVTMGHPSIYDPVVRELKVYVSIPEKVGKDTGILLLIAGFGANTQSNVYKKMRRVFSDEYDLITIQCDYFGYEYMQSDVKKETPSDFCDLGVVQAMDNLIAVKCVKDWLLENGYEFDHKKVIAYGHSHGAYIALLMNSLMPNVLSCVIDNSAWVFPVYMDKDRSVNNQRFHYIISELVMDEEIYDLKRRYATFDNTAGIVSFFGLSDNLVSINDKVSFISQVKNASIEIINGARIDRKVFFSTDHGLNADFLEMFRYVMKRYNTSSEKECLTFTESAFETSKCTYEICMEEGVPILYCTPKYNYDFDKLQNYTDQ